MAMESALCHLNTRRWKSAWSRGADLGSSGSTVLSCLRPRAKPGFSLLGPAPCFSYVVLLSRHSFSWLSTSLMKIPRLRASRSVSMKSVAMKVCSLKTRESTFKVRKPGVFILCTMKMNLAVKRASISLRIIRGRMQSCAIASASSFALSGPNSSPGNHNVRSLVKVLAIWFLCAIAMRHSSCRSLSS